MSEQELEGVSFTPIQMKIVYLMMDGMPHSREELQAFRGPSSLSTLSTTMHGVRRRVGCRGYGIVCEVVNRRICYRMVKLVGHAAALAKQGKSVS